MSKNTVLKLEEFGQSVWLDYISRSIIETGKLKSMIDMGLRGMTSNPSIFNKAVSGAQEYDREIEKAYKSGKTILEIYDDLTVRDIRDAADIFKDVYEKTNGLDGYVSLEINPKLAYNTRKTIEEGKRLYEKVNRPNVMFKVPSTDEGFPAVEELISECINVNITLIFSLQQYEETTKAYFRGLEGLLQKGGELSKVHSVASVFVSRKDTSVDNLIEERLSKEKDKASKSKLESLKGKAGIANSALIYERYLEIFYGDDFRKLQEKGANVQRVLWGSTSTKNPTYSDIKYVTELIAKNTVNTMPENTLSAFLDHGVVKEALTGDALEYHKVINELRGIGIDINDVCRKLLEDGVEAFEESFNSLLNSIEEKSKAL
ncbi:MAG: transaldolase [Candidatus Stahlbacteria bacterium]|nr:MAG: transaldolase [Candidatus Stahlbacteria bacterium]